MTGLTPSSPWWGKCRPLETVLWSPGPRQLPPVDAPFTPRELSAPASPAGQTLLASVSQKMSDLDQIPIQFRRVTARPSQSRSLRSHPDLFLTASSRGRGQTQTRIHRGWQVNLPPVILPSLSTRPRLQTPHNADQTLPPSTASSVASTRS